MIPFAFLFLCCLFLVLPFFSQPIELIVGVAIIVSGIPVYFLFVMNKKKPDVVHVPWGKLHCTIYNRIICRNIVFYSLPHSLGPEDVVLCTRMRGIAIIEISTMRGILIHVLIIC